MKHTLVIPTFNRPDLLRQLVQYYFERARSLNLLVLDSSRAELAEANAKVLAPYGEFLRHVVFPEAISSTEKLAQGLDLVHTPYASFCGDDDLVFPGPLRQAIDFLERNAGYCCAHGLYVNFRPEGREIHLAREYAGPSNEAGHPGARIFRLLQRYESLFYAVFRAPDLRAIMSLLPRLAEPHYQELFQSVAAAILGKVKRFPALYAARRSGPPAQPNREKWQTYDWFARNPGEVLEHYKDYRLALWSFYKERGAPPRLDREPFLRALDLAHAVYFAAGCQPEYFHSALQAYWPDDDFLDVTRVNLFTRPLLPGGYDLSRLPTAAGYAIGVGCAVPYLAWLNFRIARACRGAWKCVPALNQRWLAMSPEFRGGCIELCRYMDHA